MNINPKEMQPSKGIYISYNVYIFIFNLVAVNMSHAAPCCIELQEHGVMSCDYTTRCIDLICL
jgi:hypothetical protein